MEQRYRSLAEDIRRKASRLEWKRSNYDDSFELSLGKGTVIISNNEKILEEDFDANIPLYSLQFLNGRGETITVIETDGSYVDENKPLLEDIYQQAFNTYMQTEETLRSMMDDLSTK